jgi:predicted dehydrogenase
MRIRVGLLGLGDAWETRHHPALRALGDRFEVRAVCEPVSHRAELAAGDFGATSVDGFQALVHREDIDAILILSAGWYGSLPIFAACEASKALYLSTRLNLTPDDARQIKQQVEQSGIAFMAELARRQAPATLRLKELMATTLGSPRLLFCHRRLPLVEQGNLARTRSLPTPMTQELVELVDWCRYVAGREPKWVSGVTWHKAAGDHGEDYQMLSLDFSEGDDPGTGAVAQISCGRYIPAPWSEAITYRPLAAMQVSCQRGIAFVDLPATLVWFDAAGRHQESLQSERPVGEQLLAQFHRVVTGQGPKICGLDDAYRALVIVEQAVNSHRHGRRIEL